MKKADLLLNDKKIKRCKTKNYLYDKVKICDFNQKWNHIDMDEIIHKFT